MSVSRDFYSLFLFDSDGRVIPFAQDAFVLYHGQEYKVRVYNHSRDRRIDASIEIDGKWIGTFRVKPNSFVEIERPESVARKFTFFSVHSAEGRLAGLNVNHVGGIVVSIEREAMKSHPKCNGFCYQSDDGGGGAQTDKNDVVCDGGTGLGSASRQCFTRASDQMILERGNVTVLMARMRLAAAIVPLS